MRRAIVAGLAVIVLAVTGGLALARPSHRSAAVFAPSMLRERLAPLRHSLEAYLAAANRPRTMVAPRPHVLAVPRLPPGPMTCQVAVARCALIPCREFAGASASLLLATQAVVGAAAPRPKPCRRIASKTEFVTLAR